MRPPQDDGPSSEMDDEAQTREIRATLDALFRLAGSRRLQSKQNIAAGVDLSGPGFQLLTALASRDEWRLGELAQSLGMDQAMVGRQTKRLEEDGLVVRSVDPDDGRATIVTVTRRGLRVLARRDAVAQDHMSRTFASWSRRERTSFARQLQRFVQDARATTYRSIDEIRGDSEDEL